MLCRLRTAQHQNQEANRNHRIRHGKQESLSLTCSLQFSARLHKCLAPDHRTACDPSMPCQISSTLGRLGQGKLQVAASAAPRTLSSDSGQVPRLSHRTGDAIWARTESQQKHLGVCHRYGKQWKSQTLHSLGLHWHVSLGLSSSH